MTKRGKGTKIMLLIDGWGVPLGLHLARANPAEVKLAEATLASVGVPRSGPGRPRQKPERVIADRAYDSDALRRRLAARGIELVCPHRRGRRRPPRQDGRRLRRYRRRWRVERTFAWLTAWRRIGTRFDRDASMYHASVLVVTCMLILRWL